MEKHCWPSIHCIGGVFGKQPRKVKPMCNLPKADLVWDLWAHRFYDLDQQKSSSERVGDNTERYTACTITAAASSGTTTNSTFSTTLFWIVSHFMTSRAIYCGNWSATINSPTRVHGRLWKVNSCMPIKEENQCCWPKDYPYWRLHASGSV